MSCIFVLRKHGLGKGRVASWMKRIRKKEIQKKQKCIPKQSVAGSRVTCLATLYFAEDVKRYSKQAVSFRRRDSGDVYPEDVEGKSRRLTDGKRVIANIPRFFFQETCKQTAREIFSQKMCNQIGGFYWLKGADSGRCVIKSV